MTDLSHWPWDVAATSVALVASPLISSQVVPLLRNVPRSDNAIKDRTQCCRRYDKKRKKRGGRGERERENDACFKHSNLLGALNRLCKCKAIYRMRRHFIAFLCDAHKQVSQSSILKLTFNVLIRFSMYSLNFRFS